MYLKRCGPAKSKKESIYWELVESYRSERGPRQRVVAYLGDIGRAEREGIEHTAEGKKGYWQRRLFDEEGEPEWVEVDTSRVKVGQVRDFGGYWLGLEMLDRLDLTSFLERTIPRGREDIEWSVMSLALVLWRLCEPSSELHMVEHLYDKSPVGELLGIPDEKMNDNRLYRLLDNLLPHKVELEKYLKERLGEMFNLEYDLLLYDVTSTYFEGEAPGSRRMLFSVGG